VYAIYIEKGANNNRVDFSDTYMAVSTGTDKVYIHKVQGYYLFKLVKTL